MNEEDTAWPGTGYAATGDEVELVRLDRDSGEAARLRAEAVRLPLLPGQRRFVTPAAHTLPRADADPNRTPFVVVLHGVVVGFGILDRGGSLVALTHAPETAVLLRAFYVAPEWQGHGVGRAACANLDALVRVVAPETTEILLTVNETNRAGIRAYGAGGFVDTGRRYLGGDAGPQFVLRRAVAR